MSLEGIIKIIGWVFLLLPLSISTIISFFMFRGAAKDDELIMVMLILGITIFLIGAGILVLFYLTDLGTALIS